MQKEIATASSKRTREGMPASPILGSSMTIAPTRANTSR